MIRHAILQTDPGGGDLFRFHAPGDMPGWSTDTVSANGGLFAWSAGWSVDRVLDQTYAQASAHIKSKFGDRTAWTGKTIILDIENPIKPYNGGAWDEALTDRVALALHRRYQAARRFFGNSVRLYGYIGRRSKRWFYNATDLANVAATRHLASLGVFAELDGLAYALYPADVPGSAWWALDAEGMVRKNAEAMADLVSASGRPLHALPMLAWRSFGAVGGDRALGASELLELEGHLERMGVGEVGYWSPSPVELGVPVRDVARAMVGLGPVEGGNT